jgi:hypothetical protein
MITRRELSKGIAYSAAAGPAISHMVGIGEAESKWSDGPVQIEQIDYERNGAGIMVLVDVRNQGFVRRDVSFEMSVRVESGHCTEAAETEETVGPGHTETLVLHYNIDYEDIGSPMSCQWDLETSLF